LREIKLTGILAVIFGIAVWHVAALNSISMYTGAFAKTWLPAPKQVIFSRAHGAGLMCAALAVLVLVVSNRSGILNYGIFVAVGLLFIDAYLIYKAVTSYSE
jgi:hypothetical protein